MSELSLVRKTFDVVHWALVKVVPWVKWKDIMASPWKERASGDVGVEDPAISSGGLDQEYTERGGL